MAKKTSFGIVATKKWVTSLIHEVLQRFDKALINKPHLWEPGKEYDFGDNTYGQRFVGTTSATSNGQIILDATLKPDKVYIYSVGGVWDRSTGGSSYDVYPVGNIYASTAGDTMKLANHFSYTNDIGFRWLYVNNTNKFATKYDIWILYTKK